MITPSPTANAQDVTATHTPGPWSIIIDDHDISVSGEGWFDDQHVNGWMIVGNIDNPNMAIAILDTGFQNQWNDTENDANARLIAAAPDLLAVAQAVNAAAKGGHDTIALLLELHRIGILADAAIAKANAA